MKLDVFVCEDVEGIQAFLADLFDSIGGLEVLGMTSSEPAAKSWLAVHGADWDLAIVDLVLEEGSGFGVITAARQVHPQGRIAVYSSYLTPAVRAHCIALGADAVFEKSDATGFVAWVSAELAPRPRP